MRGEDKSLGPRQRSARVVPYVVFGVSLFVTFVVWQTAVKATEEKEEARFSVSRDRVRDAIEIRVQRQVELLRTTAAMIAANEDVSRQSFKRFYQSLDLAGYPGMLGLGFTRYVPKGEEDDIVRRLRSEGRSQFHLFPKSDETHAIVYLEPEGGANEVAFGYNMHADEVRAQAMDYARDWNQPGMTSAVHLIQDKHREGRMGFLIYVPVYYGGDPGGTLLRRKRLRGFVYSPFRADELLNGVLSGQSPADVAVTVFDGAQADPGHQFFTNVSRYTGRHSKVVTSEMPGHQWTVRYSTLPAFDQTSDRELINWIPVAGFIMSLMLGGLSLAQSRANRDLERNAEQLHRRAYQQRLLAQAGALLGASLQVEQTLTSVAQLAVPSFADWCAVDLIEPNGDLRRVATVHIDPNKVRWARELATRYPPDPEAEQGVHAVARTGQSELYRSIPRDMLVASAKDADHMRIIDEIGLSSAIIVPMIARDQTLGVVSFVWAESGFHYDEEDLRLAEEIGSRAGLAVDNARLYESAQDELRVSTTLQRVGMRLAGELDQKRLVQYITDEATDLTRATIGAFLYNSQQPDGQSRKLYSISGVDTEAAGSLAPPDESLLAATITDRETTRIGDIREDPRFGKNPPFGALAEGHPPVVSFLAVPVASRSGETLGALLFGHPEANRFGEREEMIAKGLAAYAAIALDNAILFTDKQKELEERRRAEERVRDLNENLERLVKERTTELEASNHELEAFCYSVSHDLRGPLRSVDGFSKAVIEDYGNQLDAEGLHYLERVRAAARRMDELITALLNLSRLTRAEIHREPVDLSSLARDVADEVAAASGLPQVELEVEPGLRVDADPRMARIVLDNLIANAIKFSSKVEHPKLYIGRKDDALFVRDNGVGFNPEYYGKLFSPFERLHGGSDYPGSGIGLATVQRVIARHGGKVWAESEEGKGATFFFTFG